MTFPTSVKEPLLTVNTFSRSLDAKLDANMVSADGVPHNPTHYMTILMCKNIFFRYVHKAFVESLQLEHNNMACGRKAQTMPS